jgi:hypothetical protein
MSVLKTCFKCVRSLPRAEFYRHPQMADGLLGKCKECTKADSRATQARLPRLSAPLTGNERLARRVARRKVQQEIKSGRLTPPTRCAACDGCHVRIEAHHVDYSRPLDVMWLCVRCHQDQHIAERQARLLAQTADRELAERHIRNAARDRQRGALYKARKAGCP